MTIKLISFDLQGTLCDHAFSSEVWLTLLPRSFNNHQAHMTVDEYKTLQNDFNNIRQDDPCYYDLDYWLERIGSSERTFDLARRALSRPQIFPEMKELVQDLSSQAIIIIVSATTRKFLDLELGTWKNQFEDVYSTYDDFQMPGKPPIIFSEIAKQYGCQPNECLHLGDHPEMDGVNPRLAEWFSIYDPSETLPIDRADGIRHFLKNGCSQLLRTM